MRRLVVAIFVAVVALSLGGCGGGSQPAATPAATPAAAPAAAPAPAAAAAGIANRSENETETFVPFPDKAFVPADLKQKITVEKQPTLIYFYDSSQQSSKEVRAIIDAVRNDNRGLVNLVAFDIGKYVITGSDGVVTVDDTKFAHDPTASQAVQLARELGVSFTPFIVLTDGQGYVIYKQRGLVDRAFLEREVLRASR
jgi:thioredoxin-related protein